MQYVEHKGKKIEVKYGSLDLSNRGIYDISKDEVIKRVNSGYNPVILYLIEVGFLQVEITS